MTVESQFFSKVEESASGCWEWKAGTSASGYGVFRGNSAHRWIYEFMVGEIPEGYQVDHLCRNRACVNYEHLEAVTPSENQRRAKSAMTTCANGHPAEEKLENYYKGWGRCRLCRNAAMKRWRDKRRVA